jgi:hypothetical protein
MNIPGCNAETSLYESGNKYHSRSAGTDRAAFTIIPAAILNRNMACFTYSNNLICIQQSIVLADAVEINPFGPGD